MQNPDPLAELAYDLTPNRYCFNNPMRFIDPSGLWETTAGGYKTDKPEDIKRFMSYLGFENNALNNAPNSEQMSSFIDGEMSPEGHGKTSNGGVLADEISITNKKMDEKSFSDFWHGVQRTQTPEALDPRTIGKNIFDLSYPGPDNPKTYSGNDDFSYVPKSIAEYPAIGHDRRYANLGIAGASGLLTDTRAISTDFRFVAQSFMAIGMTNSYKEKWDSFKLGMGLGFLASFKTIYHFTSQSCMSSVPSVVYWDTVANKGVSNAPSNK